MKTDESPGRSSRYPKVAGTTVIETNQVEYEAQDPDYFVRGQNIVTDRSRIREQMKVGRN